MPDKDRFSRILSKAKAVAAHKWALIITGLVVAGVIGLLSLPVISSALYAHKINNRELLMNRNSTGIVILDRHGEALYQYGKINTYSDVSLEEIADTMEQAVIASEDQNFYEHPGYSLRGIIAALYANLRSQDLTSYGGSTITQQLVKNTLLSDSKNYLRKMKEVAIATAIDRQYSKDEILEMYLNSVYFGEGTFGVHEAARVYFNKHPRDLTLAESSILVGLLPAPSTYSPMTGDVKLAKQQQERVLELMAENGYINETQQKAALNAKLDVAEPQPAVEYAHHFVEMVLNELHRRYDEETIVRSGFYVTTGLDLKWQKQAEANILEQINQLRSLGASNAAIVAIDPQSGEIRALAGSVDWHNETFGKVNMALSPRQPGSSFKPIFYTEALDKGVVTPATIIKDERVSYGNYVPQNYDRRFRGNVTVRHALANSLNIPAIKVMERLGVQGAAQAARRMGIDTITDPQRYGLAFALGTAEASLLDMTNAYAAFANQGTQYNPVLITSIKDKYDHAVFQHEVRGRQVVSPQAAFLMSSILSETKTRHPVFNVLNISGRDVAAKTGTTDDNKDAWTIGYAPNLSVGVWVGNNNQAPMNNVFGSNGAAPVWRKSIIGFLADLPNEAFNRPPGIIQLRVCRSNGQRALSAFPGTYVEYFMEQYTPNGICQPPKPPKPKIPETDESEDEEQGDHKPRREAADPRRGNNGGRGGNPDKDKEDKPPEPDEDTEDDIEIRPVPDEAEKEEEEEKEDTTGTSPPDGPPAEE